MVSCIIVVDSKFNVSYSSVLSFIGGIVWMGLLAHIELNERNYFSENQLLPGMVQTYYSSTHSLNTILQELKTICKNDIQNRWKQFLIRFQLSLIGKKMKFNFLFFSLLRKMREKVVSDFLEMNLDVYMQNYQILSKVRSFCYTFPQWILFRKPFFSKVSNCEKNGF